MILKSQYVLDRFRTPGRCLGCGEPCPDGRDPHHVLSRGAGGSDVSWNIASLCRECHSRLDGDVKFRQKIEERVAVRERVNMNVIEEARSFILRLPKKASLRNVEILMRDLSHEAAALVVRAFAEADEDEA